MTADTIIRWVRGALLLGLLAYFALSLYRGLARDESAGMIGQQSLTTRPDPGVRVLLANRIVRSGADAAAEPSRWHEDKVEFSILQQVLVVTPDDPDNSERQLLLKPGASLTVLVNGPDGMMLNSAGWGRDGREKSWNVSRIRLLPVATFPLPVDHESLSRRNPCLFEAADRDAVVAFAGRRYRGAIEILWHSAKDLAVVNCLPLESYVEGVVAVEMSPSYPLEALKAQAIVSRSYAYVRQCQVQLAKSRQPWDVVDGIEDQDYRGTGNGSRVVTQAVIDTRGTVTCTDMSFGSYPFAPLFCASSGGYTADVRTVLRDPRDAYGHALPISLMPSIKDDYCLAGAQGLGYTGSHWATTTVLKGPDIRVAVNRYLKQFGDKWKIGYVKDLKVGRRDPFSNRALTVLIHHTEADAPSPMEIPANDFRMILGPSLIRSTLWSAESPRRIDAVEKNTNTKNHQIQCLGYGHGAGMSQISAWEMARQGHNAKFILEYFYRGVVLGTKW